MTQYKGQLEFARDSFASLCHHKAVGRREIDQITEKLKRKQQISFQYFHSADK